MTVFIRVGLAVLLLDQLVVGGWNAIAPESFYRHFPTVDLTPPFSEHYARDFGGATLGIALLLAIALVTVALLGIAIIVATAVRDRRDPRRRTAAGPVRP